jgi:hypothetical protein
MFPFLDCSPNRLQELAIDFPTRGQLLTPLTGYCLDDKTIFAIDNGGFTSQNPEKLDKLIQRSLPFIDRCRFICMPDVPGSAIRTLELFHIFKKKYTNLPIALVIQDGQENLPIPWEELSGIFIAGRGEYKMTSCTTDIIKTAKWLKKWVHIGRLSNAEKFHHFNKLGADSFDSSVLVRDFDDRLSGIKRAVRGEKEPGLFDEVDNE